MTSSTCIFDKLLSLDRRAKPKSGPTQTRSKEFKEVNVKSQDLT